jgi:renalase
LCHKEGTSDNLWTATAKDGSSENFHGVILTIPVPQILQLAGTFQDCLKNHRSLLEKVEYSSRYALALYFSKEAHFEMPWTAKYVKDHPCIRFVSVDSVKRGTGMYWCWV